MEQRAKNLRYPLATIILILINIIYLVYLYISGAVYSTDGMIRSGALYIPKVVMDHEYYRLATAMFMHFSLEHIFGNMLLLYMLGKILEEEFGAAKFTVLYLTAGLAANAVSLYYYKNTAPNTVTAGASGAVFGLVGMTLFILIANRGHYRGLTLRRIVFMIIFSIYSGCVSGGINNIGHVAGLACGFILGLVFYRTEPIWPSDDYMTRDDDRRYNGWR